jgi:hypothetical protein
MTGEEHYFAAQSQGRGPRVLEAVYKQRLRKPGQRAWAKESTTHAPDPPRKRGQRDSGVPQGKVKARGRLSRAGG